MKDCSKCPWSNNYSWNNRKCGCDKKDESYCPIEHYNENHIEERQPLYINGLGYGMRTHCVNIYEENGERIIETNNGYKRKESDILLNTGDVCPSKITINNKLKSSWMSESIPEDNWL